MATESTSLEADLIVNGHSVEDTCGELKTTDDYDKFSMYIMHHLFLINDTHLCIICNFVFVQCVV